MTETKRRLVRVEMTEAEWNALLDHLAPVFSDGSGIVFDAARKVHEGRYVDE